MSKPAKHVLIAASLVGAFVSTPASATCSAEPMLGSICIVAYNFCPRGYADAAGQLLSISQNTALFSLLGTQFGGNGQTTFALPDLRGRAPVGVGQGPGLSPIVEGEQAGQENVTLTVAQMPAHTHGAQLRGTSSNGNTDSPAGAVPAKLPRSNIYSNGAAGDAMGASALTIATTGNSQPVNVRNPYLGLRYCIALQGIYPSRN
jgi:microcystin-dependent protein